MSAAEKADANGISSREKMLKLLRKEHLDEVKVDFKISSWDDNITANLDKLELLSDELDEYLTSYAVGYASTDMTIYQKNHS